MSKSVSRSPFRQWWNSGGHGGRGLWVGTGGHSVARRGREPMRAMTIWKGWQVVRGFLEFVGCLFPTFPSISQVQMHNLPVYFISSEALVYNRDTTEHQTPALLPWDPSPCPLVEVVGLPGCPCSVPLQRRSCPKGAPLLPRHVVSTPWAQALHSEEGTARALQALLPAAASLPACLLEHGEEHAAPRASLSQNTNAEKHILKCNRLRSSRPSHPCKNLMILHVDISLDARAMMIHREPSAL